MKQLNVCLILCIALVSTINTFPFSSLIEVQELKSNIFGSNLIETIALTFQTPNKVSAAKEVLTMLEELKTQLTTDQSNDSHTYESKKTEFDNHIKKLEDEIESLTAEIKFLASEIERLAGLISQADKNIESFTKRVENLKELLREMKESNDNDNKYYNQKIKELETIYNTFTLVLQKLDKLIGSVSARDIPSHVNLTESEKRDREWAKNNTNIESKLAKSFLQVETEELTNMVKQLSGQYNSFLETTLNADQGALNKLKDIITKLQDDILAKKNNAITHLADINSKFEELKKQTDEEITLNENSKKTQVENRDQYKVEKAKKETEKANKEKRRELLTNEKKINEDLRNKLKMTFEKEKIERAAELDIVEKLIRIVESRLVNKLF